MPLHKYATEFYGLRIEVEDMLLPDDEQQAFEFLQQITKEDWRQWVKSQKPLILSFLSQTPSQRKKKAIWRDNKTRKLFLIAVLVYARWAYAFTCTADEMQNIVGQSYRKAHSYAADEAASLFAAIDVLWPFSGVDPWGAERQLDPKPLSYGVEMPFLLPGSGLKTEG